MSFPEYLDGVKIKPGLRVIAFGRDPGTVSHKSDAKNCNCDAKNCNYWAVEMDHKPPHGCYGIFSDGLHHWALSGSIRPVNYPKTALRIKELPSKDLHKLKRLIGEELNRRHILEVANDLSLSLTMGAMANVMAGAAWAMACRAQLRWSKGHDPLGSTPVGGQMWYPWEIEEAANKKPGVVQAGLGSDWKVILYGKTVQQPYNNPLKAKTAAEFIKDTCWPGIWLTPNNKKAAPLFTAERPSLGF